MDWFVIGPEMLGVLFAVALLAGFIDSIAGGGGLLTVPALLAVGVSPAQALATNKLQSVGGSFSASLYFIRRRALNLNDQKLTIFLTLIESGCATLILDFASCGEYRFSSYAIFMIRGMRQFRA